MFAVYRISSDFCPPPWNCDDTTCVMRHLSLGLTRPAVAVHMPRPHCWTHCLGVCRTGCAKCSTFLTGTQCLQTSRGCSSRDCTCTVESPSPCSMSTRRSRCTTSSAGVCVIFVFVNVNHYGAGENRKLYINCWLAVLSVSVNLGDLHSHSRKINKGLANAKRPCDCSVNFFRYLRLRRYKRKFVEVGVFWGGWVTFGEHFGWKGTIPSNSHRSGKTGDIHISCGVEILTDDYFVLSQYTHLTDRLADNRRTDGRQNCDSNTVRCITCSRTVKINNET